MKTILATIAILLSFMNVQFALAVTFEKPLRAELKRFIPNNEYTLSEIKTPDKYKIDGNFLLIESKADTKAKFIYTGRVITSRGSSKNETADYFDYFIIYNSKQAIEKVKIFNFQSSHGEAVTSAGWLKQFVGYNGQILLSAGKNIDAISGATISVNNLTFDIQAKTKILLEIVK